MISPPVSPDAQTTTMAAAQPSAVYVPNTSGKGRVARRNQNAIGIVYDTPLYNPCCGGCMYVCYPCCCLGWPFCSRIDLDRSYIYLRENSIESNLATKHCVLCCAWSQDRVTTYYYDKAPFAPSCCKFMLPFGCYPTTDPQVTVKDMGCLICCINCTPPCIRKYEVR